MRLLPWLMLSTSVMLACGMTDDDLPDDPVDAAHQPPASLQQRIEAAVARIQADTCFTQTDTSGCVWDDYDIDPAYFNMAVSTHEAILIVDSFGEGVRPQFVRYRNRIKGIYRVEGDAIEPQDISVHLPKALGDSLLSFAGPEFIPSAALLAVSQAAGKAYSKLALVYLGHGGVVYGHLVELAPEQPIVLLELEGLLGLQPALCEGVTPASLATAAAHYSAVAAALRQRMTQHKVRFVNASFGNSVQTMASDWTRTCGSAVPSTEVLRQLLHLYDPVYDALFNSPGVVAAHAAANLGAAADFPFDQVSPAFANRVRVGFISSLASGLDALGRGTVQKAEQFPRDGDADVYVNWDCEAFIGCADPHYEMAGAFGLGAFSVVVMSTSYVNPLGLGRLINLRYANHAGQPMTNALIQTLKLELTPSLCGADGHQPCVYQDPLLHRQLEVYRRNYRTVE